jgi:hypothetical protein
MTHKPTNQNQDSDPSVRAVVDTDLVGQTLLNAIPELRAGVVMDELDRKHIKECLAHNLPRLVDDREGG